MDLVNDCALNKSVLLYKSVGHECTSVQVYSIGVYILHKISYTARMSTASTKVKHLLLLNLCLITFIIIIECIYIIEWIFNNIVKENFTEITP